jgi:hypothetical protein
LREYVRDGRAPGQVATLVVSGLFVVAAVLDASSGTLDNVVHLAFGLVGIGLSRDRRASRGFLIGGGVAYVLLWQFGSVIDPALVPFHTANVGIHLALVASMIGLAVLDGGDRDTDEATAPEFEYVRESAEPAAPRPTRNRPPGRDDRRVPRAAVTARPYACRPTGSQYRRPRRTPASAEA